MKLLRDRGYRARPAEAYNAAVRRSRDLFGFIDIAALHKNYPGVLAVQTTTGDHLKNRIDKAESLPAYWDWLACMNAVEFHGWRKIKGLWEPRIVRVDYTDLIK